VRAAAAKAIADAQPSPTFAKRRAAAAAHLVLGDAAAAVQALEALAREMPSDATVHNDLAAAYLARAEEGGAGDYDRALRVAVEAARLNPQLAEAWFNRAVAAAALGRSDEAAAAVRRLAELEPTSAWAALLRRS